jgi:hypothetical protein
VAAVFEIVAALAPRFGYREEPPNPPGYSGAESSCKRLYRYQGSEAVPDACVELGKGEEIAHVTFWMMGVFRMPAPARAFRDALADSLRHEGRVTVRRR